MLAECDFVVISAPLTAGTRGWFGAEAIAAMRDGACLVDISRGGIVDEEALRKALQEGKLGGAALDVFAQEPLPEESDLWDTPGLLFTPHIAGASPRSTTCARRICSRKICGATSQINRCSTATIRGRNIRRWQRSAA